MFILNLLTEYGKLIGNYIVFIVLEKERKVYMWFTNMIRPHLESFQENGYGSFLLIQKDPVLYVPPNFLPKEGCNFTAEQQYIRSLIPKHELRVLDIVRENVFLHYTTLERADNAASKNLFGIPPNRDEQGLPDYSDCPRPLEDELSGLFSKGALTQIKWDDNLLVKQFYDNISSLQCRANGVLNFSDYDRRKNRDEMFGEGFLPDVFYKWITTFCKANLSESLNLLQQSELPDRNTPLTFLLKAIVYSVKVGSISLYDPLSNEPIYSCVN